MVYVSVVSSLVFGMIWPWKISASFLIEIFFSVTKGANRAAGAGFFSALIKSVSACVDASAEEIPGIAVFSGNNSTASVMCYAVVLEILTL